MADMTDATPLASAQITQEDRITAAIGKADAAFGYSFNLTRLVDGEETYTLFMPGFAPVEFNDRDDGYALIAERRNKARADAILAALNAPTGAVGEVSGELKPCPFCGGEAEVIRKETRVLVICPSAGPVCMMLRSESYGNDDAITAWNTRATPSQGLDAATVERIAIIINNGHGDPKHKVPSAAGEAWKVAQQKAVKIAALATDPHQHGGNA